MATQILEILASRSKKAVVSYAQTQLREHTEAIALQATSTLARENKEPGLTL
jgi:hypothetical protein